MQKEILLSCFLDTWYMIVCYDRIAETNKEFNKIFKKHPVFTVFIRTIYYVQYLDTDLEVNFICDGDWTVFGKIWYIKTHRNLLP